jgi:hypothetical protein
MPALLTLHPAGRPSRPVLIDNGESLTIGRDPATSSLAVDEAVVSKTHARL